MKKQPEQDENTTYVLKKAKLLLKRPGKAILSSQNEDCR